MLQAFVIATATIVAAVFLLWLLSIVRRDVSIVDVFWGLGFVMAAWIYRFWGPPLALRHGLLLALVTVWGLRLSFYIFWRNRGGGEDRRYARMRAARGDAFWWQSFFTVFLLQGLLIAALSVPFLVVEVGAAPPGLGWTDYAGLAVWLVGFFFEAVGDWQMARFKADPANHGKVMRRGLWALTRHPNYFGDATQWWGYFLIALGAPGGLYTLPAPVMMTLLLLRVSGVALLERTIVERRPAYRDYIASTSAFLPWFPGSGEGRGGEAADDSACVGRGVRPR